MPSIRRVVTFRAQTGNHSGDPVNTIMEDQHLLPQHTTSDVPVVRMPEFWPHAATYQFLVLEAKFRVHRITKQDLQYAILGQWLTEQVAIEVSDVILGPPSETNAVTWNYAKCQKIFQVVLFQHVLCIMYMLTTHRFYCKNGLTIRAKKELTILLCLRFSQGLPTTFKGFFKRKGFLGFIAILRSYETKADGHRMQSGASAEDLQMGGCVAYLRLHSDRYKAVPILRKRITREKQSRNRKYSLGA